MKYQCALLDFSNWQLKVLLPRVLKAWKVQRDIGEGWNVSVASQLGCTLAEMKVQQLIQNLYLEKMVGVCVNCNLFEEVEDGLKNGSCKGK